MSYLQETQEAGREVFPDLARAWALFGIALVNVGVMSWPMMTGYGEAGLATGIDQTLFFIVAALFMSKSYTLFSFMFGVGFAYQMRSAEQKGVGFAGRYWRRILGLLFFGLLNIAFLFQGDILVMYAILGSLLFLFRKSSPRLLSGWALSVYGLQILIVCLGALAMWAGATFDAEAFSAEIATMTENADAAAEAFRTGSLVDSISQRFADWSQVITFGMFMQGVGVFSFFLFGLSAVKRGTISNPSAPFWKRCRHIFLPIGLAISALGAWFALQASGSMDPVMMLGMALIIIGSPFSTAGYLGVIAKWADAPSGPIKTFFARGGTSSLTAYLMQGLLLSLIFNAYGLGYFEQIGAGGAIAIAAAVAIFTIAFASLWRTMFKRGPLEYVLRGFTYLGAR
ncbi:MAG: DUF418 domain-containing protein [Pseudomonadota bacterium]